MIRPAETARGGIFLGNDREDLEEGRQKPALVRSFPVVDHDLLGPQLTLLLLELPDAGGALQHELTAARLATLQLLLSGPRRLHPGHGEL